MPARSFAADAGTATSGGLPVVRAVVFRFHPPTAPESGLEGARALVAEALPSWQVEAVEGIASWYAASPADAGTPIALGVAWAVCRGLARQPGVSDAEPSLLIANPSPPDERELDSFAMGIGQEQFALWGKPYDDATEKRIREAREAIDWHLAQLNVRKAWDFHRQLLPGQEPGAGVLVGHPDTGYTEHPQVAARLRLPGRSFVRDEHGQEEPEARDDLNKTGDHLVESPGHGTATASVIASPANDEGSTGKDVLGVAPGATVLPLRVSTSVVHFDFGNVSRAILHAAFEGADVISMSLGGPTKSGLLRDCIREAQEKGVIVVAAAGNMVPTTMFPAAFPEVIAVAATHAAEAPWRFSGLGRLVDIAAPGEDVLTARTKLSQPATAAPAEPAFSTGAATGTSFATACVAGLAALWLSRHGGRAAVAAHYGSARLVPFAFQFALARTARKDFSWVAKNMFGAGIPDAEALLRAALPAQPEVARFEAVIRAQKSNFFTLVSGLFRGGLAVADDPAVELALAAVDDPGVAVALTNAVLRAEAEATAERDLFARLLGDRAEDLAPELAARIGADLTLLSALQRLRQGESNLPLVEGVMATEGGISSELRTQLRASASAESARLAGLHTGALVHPFAAGPSERGPVRGAPAPPALRQLRAYAFDPSLDTQLDTSTINQVTIPVRWEQVTPGPRGEYLEVADIDPSSSCAYSPVDLNHPYLLAQDGRAPSEGDPQFHQQMVYAVAMNTIHRFELALGRPVFWSPLRPWLADRPDERHHYTPESLDPPGTVESESAKSRLRNRDRYVQRLRIYPHALREANAYYSPAKRALLFGYFPGASDDTGRHYPGGLVFTCLSHDIIAHETTHALLDGMHPYFNEPSNPDVWAFHEAFADIVALFQHFTYPEVLRHQIANTRGDLETNNLLAMLAQQFGQASGGRDALRNALGHTVDGQWQRTKADPNRLRSITTPHERGSILVAAVFDAFLALYNDRVADLVRISTGGTGVLSGGRIHPDLVNRLANEAAAVAEEVLRICIRAMDYVPPVDITFGEFLRALVTADYDFSPTGRRRTRIAFIEAFRSWGIYPRDVPTLSEDSLRWRAPSPDDALVLLPLGGLTESDALAPARRSTTPAPSADDTVTRLVRALEAWQPLPDERGIANPARADMFAAVLEAQGALHGILRRLQAATPNRPLLPGLNLSRGGSFNVANLRPARRVGPQGEFRTEMVFEVVQTRPRGSGDPPGAQPFRGGATVVVDLRTRAVRYIIYKRLYDRVPDTAILSSGLVAARAGRQAAFEATQLQGLAGRAQAEWLGEGTDDLAGRLAATYSSPGRRLAAIRSEPFALLHRSVE